jgi:hypothetical protein
VDHDGPGRRERTSGPDPAEGPGPLVGRLLLEDVLRGVLELLAGLLDVAGGLVALPLGLEALVVGRLADAFLVLPFSSSALLSILSSSPTAVTP